MKTNEIKCCTPNGQIKRYKDCIGCDRNPLELNQNKMTAVEWFFNEIKHILPNDFLVKYEQAKEMEKEQIIIAYDKGDENGANRVYYHDIKNDVSAEQYYNETFKSE